MLDPVIEEIARKWKESGLPQIYTTPDGVEARRRALVARTEFYPMPHIEVGSVEDITIPGPGGPMVLRVVRPKEGPATGTVVYFHGGGWIVGDIDQYQAHVARIANETGSVVINVDYRLAPEHPYPAGVEDAVAATAWVHNNIGRFGGDPARLAVAGDSAGGNLAAIVALECRDRGIPLAAQMLLYPATDLRTADPDIGVKYIGEDFAKVAENPRISPVLEPSVAGVAPAIIGIGTYDYLYKDSIDYAAVLRRDGVPLIMREYPTLNHGFFSYTGISADSLRAAHELCADLKGLLHGGR